MSTNPLLTVNLGLPAVAKSGEETDSFARLLFGLTALALERFDAARENHCQEAPRKSVPPCPAGVLGDPFDGHLLRISPADNCYRPRGIGPEPKEAPGRNGDLELTAGGSSTGLAPVGVGPEPSCISQCQLRWPTRTIPAYPTDHATVSL